MCDLPSCFSAMKRFVNLRDKACDSWARRRRSFLRRCDSNRCPSSSACFWRFARWIRVSSPTAWGASYRWRRILDRRMSTSSHNIASTSLIASRFALIGKKVELLIQLFDLRWEISFSIFSLRTFGKIGPFPVPDKTLDEINIIYIFHDSESNETMRKILASIV